MKKPPIHVLFDLFPLFAQLQIFKAFGKNATDYGLGIGPFLKFAYPVSDGSDATLDLGVLFFQEQDDPSSGIGVFPLWPDTAIPLMVPVLDFI